MDYYDLTVELDTNEDGQEIETNTYQCTFDIEGNDGFVSGSCDLVDVWKNGVKIPVNALTDSDIEFFESTAWNRYMEGSL